MKKLLKKLMLFVVVVSFCAIPKAYALTMPSPAITETLHFTIASIDFGLGMYTGLYDRGTVYQLATTGTDAGYWVPGNYSGTTFIPDTTTGQEKLLDNTYTPSSGTSLEDTWGIFRVSNVSSNVRGTLFNATGSSTTQIVGMFGGFVDVLVKDDPLIPGNQLIYADGGWMKVWENGRNITGGADSYEYSVNSGIRTGVDSFTGISTGNLLIDTTGYEQYLGSTTNTFTLSESINLISLTGGGALFMDVNPGTSSIPQLDSNTLLNGADMSFTFTSDPSNKGRYIVSAAGNAYGYSVPEPASLLLLGLGLFGLGIVRRFRKN